MSISNEKQTNNNNKTFMVKQEIYTALSSSVVSGGRRGRQKILRFASDFECEMMVLLFCLQVTEQQNPSYFQCCQGLWTDLL